MKEGINKSYLMNIVSLTSKPFSCDHSELVEVAFEVVTSQNVYQVSANPKDIITILDISLMLVSLS